MLASPVFSAYALLLFSLAELGSHKHRGISQAQMLPFALCSSSCELSSPSLKIQQKEYSASHRKDNGIQATERKVL